MSGAEQTGGRRGGRSVRVAIGTAAVALTAGGLVVAGTMTTQTVQGGPATAAADLGQPAVSCVMDEHPDTGSGFVLDIDEGVFTPIDAPGANFETVPMGINNQRQIVGGYDDVDGLSHGFLLEDGDFTVIDAPDAVGGTALIKINNQGQILGVYDDARNDCHGFVLEDGVFTPVKVPGAPTQPMGLNDDGQIVGTYIDAGQRMRGFLLDDGEVTTIDVPGAMSTGASAINEEGEITGYYQSADSSVHSYVRDADGNFITTDAPGAGSVAATMGINNRSETVGHLSDPGLVRHGFVQRDGVFSTIDAPGAGQITQAFDLNDRGQVVGFAGRHLPGVTPQASVATADPGSTLASCDGDDARDLGSPACLMVATILEVWVLPL